MVRIRFLLGAALLASLTGAFGCNALELPSNAPQRTRPHEDAMWISPAEVKRLPMRGPAWEQVKAAAAGPLGSANVADQDSHHDVNTLAAALVYVRTGDTNYRKKAANAISSAIGTEQGGTVLALARNLLSYVIAAQLIDLKEYDPAGEKHFRTWLEEVRSEPLGSDPVGSQSLVELHERGASNGGGMAGASRLAVAVYLRD